MWENKHIKQVEQYFRAELAADRSRIQTGNISQFGLMEMSRQRLRSSVMEMYSESCPHCQGRGTRYSCDYFTSTVLSLLEKSANESPTITISVPQNIAEILLNKRRKDVFRIEEKYNCVVTICSKPDLSDEEFILDNGINEPSVLSLGKVSNEQDESKSVRNNGHINNRKMDHDTRNKKEKKLGHSDVHERSNHKKIENKDDSKLNRNSFHIVNSPVIEDVREEKEPPILIDAEFRYAEFDETLILAASKSLEPNAQGNHAQENSNAVQSENGANAEQVTEQRTTHSKLKNGEKSHKSMQMKEHRPPSDEKPRHRRRNRSPYSLIQRENQRSTSRKGKTESSSDGKKSDNDDTSERARRSESKNQDRVENFAMPPPQIESEQGQNIKDYVVHTRNETEALDRAIGPLDKRSMMEPYRQKPRITSTVRQVFGRLVGRKK
ncbi:MAG: ribonuclease E/G, partial [Holosporales bacterium]|jgi:ribonuclease E|nr:ribonuclease E/G [Holosporales bacterium]